MQELQREVASLKDYLAAEQRAAASAQPHQQQEQAAINAGSVAEPKAELLTLGGDQHAAASQSSEEPAAPAASQHLEQQLDARNEQLAELEARIIGTEAALQAAEVS